MPIESVIVVAAILLAFGSFAIALAWADRQTRNLHRGQTLQPGE